MLTCTACRQQYVGQTKRELKIRVGEHLYSIKKHHDTPVALHFNRKNHSVENVRCEILEARKFDSQNNQGNTLDTSASNTSSTRDECERLKPIINQTLLM